MSFSFSRSGRPLPHGRGSVLSTPAPNRDREGVPMVLRPAESHEDTVRPAHSRAAALFPGNLDTEPPCVSKRVFRSPCNARSPAPNRDREGVDVFAGVFNSAASFNRVDDWFAITEFHHCRCHGSGGRPIRAGRVIRGAGSQPAASILVSTNDVRAGHARPTRMVPGRRGEACLALASKRPTRVSAPPSMLSNLKCLDH